MTETLLGTIIGGLFGIGSVVTGVALYLWISSYFYNRRNR